MTQSPPITNAATTTAEPGASLWHDAWLRLRKNRLAIFGGAALILISLFCLIGPACSPYTYEQQDFSQYAKAPSTQHWFGTDKLGRDQMTRIMRSCHWR